MFRQVPFRPFNVHFSIFLAWAMSQINTELKHTEPVVNQLLTKPRRSLSLSSGFCRQIKKYQYPHNSISIKTMLLHACILIFSYIRLSENHKKLSIHYNKTLSH